ncbi:MAG: hypothetical protein IPK73_12265 [Candidatus Obscuribacter sp.]|nr:hypothetical protein [Candidatus Obscuribacter sp.]MBK9281796.1 hypothetical protein [Candidatus Obscuribacter sp.]
MTLKRIALVGMSTTGKSDLADRCINDSSGKLSDYQKIDSDEWVAQNILGDDKKPGIARVFILLGRAKALREIERLEKVGARNFL